MLRTTTDDDVVILRETYVKDVPNKHLLLLGYEFTPEETGAISATAINPACTEQNKTKR